MSIKSLALHPQHTKWSELTSLFDSKAKQAAFYYIFKKSMYIASYDRKNERIFIHLFDESSNTCYIHRVNELTRGSDDTVLLNQNPLVGSEAEKGKRFVNALLTSVRSDSASDCTSKRLLSLLVSSLKKPLKRFPPDFVSVVSLKTELSNAPAPLWIWSRLNEFFQGRKTFSHVDVITNAWRENHPESGWHIYISPKNHKSSPVDLFCDAYGNLLVDGVSWDELCTSFEGVEKMRLVVSLYHQIAEEELRVNARFALKQQQQQLAKGRPKTWFPVIYKEEAPDLLNPGFMELPPGPPVLLHEQRQVNKRPVGVAWTIGRKKEMEDAELTASGFIQTQKGRYPIEIFGVYDGHCGFRAATFVKQHLVDYLTYYLTNENSNSITTKGVVKAAKLCYQQLDADFPHEEDGTTALTAFILNGRLWLVNTGDSRAVIIKDGIVIQATEDQKPDIPRYTKTIEELGGKVVNVYRAGMRVQVPGVGGGLSMARAIGDKRYKGTSGKCVLIPDPEVTSFALKDIAGGYLVLTSDGVFENAITDQIGNGVQSMHKQGFSTEKIARHLVFASYRCSDSTDNITALVVKL